MHIANCWRTYFNLEPSSLQCGYFVLYFLVARIFDFADAFDDLIADIFSTNLQSNEKKVHTFAKWINDL